MEKTKMGRNDNCACGSGKKYKKCCLQTRGSSAHEVLDFSWRKLRHLESKVVDNHLVPYITKRLPRELIDIAWFYFLSDELPEEMDTEIFFNNFFLPWLLFNWIPADTFGIENFSENDTIALNYLRIHKNKLSGEEQQFIQAISQTHYSFYTIIGVQKEQLLEVKDIFLKTTHVLKERQGTHFLKRGDIVLGRILTFDNQSIFVGMAPYIVPSQYGHALIQLRKELMVENEGSALTSEQLRDLFEPDLFACYFEIVFSLFDLPPPILSNTDDEPFQFCQSYFTLSLGLEETLLKLLPLTLSENAEEFLSDAKRNKKGHLLQVSFPWLKPENKKNPDWDNTVMGHIQLKPGKLILETNSENRAQVGQALLAQYLGDGICFQKQHRESIEPKVKRGSTKSEVEMPLNIVASPGIQERLKQMTQRHWDTWFDLEIPALDNKTPRQAAKTSEGRELLEALLLYFERMNSEQEDNRFKVDMAFLRAELGL
jgi:disulfide oxidoreductase YuzD